MESQFSVVSNEIVPVVLANEAAGAVVTFEGRVRNHNDGRGVDRLFYEAYEELALSEGNRILTEAERRFDIHKIVAIHRVGLLEIGDVAIWMKALSSHRKAAFDACEWAMDEIKKSVPIWKREDYSEGNPEWLKGESIVSADTDRYDRQIRLPEVGCDGQAKLHAAKVLVVGAGGLGTPAVEYFVRAGVGHITVVEPDFVDISNLNRQISYGFADVGRLKVDVLHQRVQDIDHSVEFVPVAEKLDEINVEALVASHDLVLDCTDDFAAKYLMNDACVGAGVPLVTASIHRWQGQILVVDRGPCLRCLLPVPPPTFCVGTCEEEGILGTVAGFFGILQANEAIKFLLGVDGGLSDTFLAVDLRDYSVLRINRPVRSECPICSTGQMTSLDSDIEVELCTVVGGAGIVFVDVRQTPSPQELMDLVTDCVVLGSVEEAVERGAEQIVLVCQRGRTSLRRAFCLRDEGVRNAYSLVGGIDRLIKERDA